MLLYALTRTESFYELYIGILRLTISLAVFLSLLISLDRLLKVAAYARIALNTWWNGHKPEHNFGARPLPDPHRLSSLFPKVAVQLPMVRAGIWLSSVPATVLGSPCR